MTATRCRDHDWRPDPIYLYGVCRWCGLPATQPQPCQRGYHEDEEGRAFIDGEAGEPDGIGPTVEHPCPVGLVTLAIMGCGFLGLCAAGLWLAEVIW